MSNTSKTNEKQPCSGACRGKFTVTAEGVMRKHTRSIWKGGSNYETVPCEGSGKPPAGGSALPAVPARQGTTGTAKGALAKQRQAYEKLGLTWTKQAISASVESHLKGRTKKATVDA